MLQKEPLLFCLCGPTGCGKSSIASEIMKRVSGIRRSLSSTTRLPRNGEVDGIDYHFITREEFYKKVALGDFLEYATYNNNLYGTDARNIFDAQKEGKDLLLTIEVQGVESLKKIYSKRFIVIFISPPSVKDLRQRLRSRGTESEELISERLAIAQREIEILHSPGFSNYRVVNERLEDAVSEVEEIIIKEKMLRSVC